MRKACFDDDYAPRNECSDAVQSKTRLGMWMMTTLQVISAMCLTIVAIAAVTDVQGASMLDDQALIIAAERNDATTVRRLLKTGANLHARDAKGRTALLAATTHNHIESAKLLIEAGADVNAQDHKLDSPLPLAGASGYLDILKLTLKADPNFKVYNRFGGTALIPACERGHVDVVKELLNTEIDIDHVNNLGWTALLEAIILSDGGPKHQEIVRMLVSAGANVNLSDTQGVTPLQHARRSGYREIAGILESHGAR